MKKKLAFIISMLTIYHTTRLITSDDMANIRNLSPTSAEFLRQMEEISGSKPPEVHEAHPQLPDRHTHAPAIPIPQQEKHAQRLSAIKVAHTPPPKWWQCCCCADDAVRPQPTTEQMQRFYQEHPQPTAAQLAAFIASFR